MGDLPGKMKSLLTAGINFFVFFPKNQGIFMKKIIVLLLGILTAGFVHAQQDTPSDKRATPATVQLYHSLKKVSSRGFLFGHQDDPAYGVGWKYEPGGSDVKAVTGDYPALYGFELGRLELDHTVNIDSVPFDKMRGFIQDAYQRGGVVTLSWHLNNPLTGKTAWDPAPGTVLSILPGGSVNERYKSWLGKIAGFMHSLKTKSGEPIPVIFRLFHELNGSWFWWGGKNSSPENLRQLWRYTVAYLRDTLGVHNLLYAYNTDRFGSREEYLERYPGDEYVDILGFDLYQRTAVAPNTDFIREAGHMLDILDSIAGERNKIPAMTEFGYNGVPDSLWWTQTFYPAVRGHRIAYVMAWRNSGFKANGSHEFYVPYPGQVSEKDFVKFYRLPETLFQKDLTKMKFYR